jgi:hypothetical protein
MPTFLFMRKGAILDTLRGANAGSLKQLTAKYMTSGVGAPSTFPGGGQTIAGGAGSSSQGTQPAAGGLMGLFSQIPRENMMPFAVILVYIAYIIYGRQ